MPSGKSISSLKLTPMTEAEAGLLLKRLLGGYASVNLHDPETYIAEIINLLAGYPYWAGERAMLKVREVSPEFVPSVGKLKVQLEDQVRVHRSAADWDGGARQTVMDRGRQLTGPAAAPKPTYDELKAKYGPNWGIRNPDVAARPPVFPTIDDLRAEFGDAAIDAIPNASDYKWQKLHRPGATTPPLTEAEREQEDVT